MLTREQTFRRLATQMAQIVIGAPPPFRATDERPDWIPKSDNHTDVSSPMHGLVHCIFPSSDTSSVSFPFSPAA